MRTGCMDKKGKKIIILGASGHGKVLLDLALLCGYEVIGFLDDDPNSKENGGYPVLGAIKKAPEYAKEWGDSLEFIIGIGSNRVRNRLNAELDLPWATLIHPKAIIARDVTIGEGTVIMANAVVNPSTVIGKHCIINTASVVEHDNRLADCVHISPGAVLSGTVLIGVETHIGAKAVIKNNLVIAERVIVGAGAVVVKDIMEPGVYVGVPATALRKLL